MDVKYTVCQNEATLVYLANPGFSAPLHWEEVNAKHDQKDFHIHTIMDRIRREGDLWQGLVTEAIDLKALLKW